MKTKLKIIIPTIIAIAAVIIAAMCISFAPKASQNIDEMLSTAQKYLVEQNYEQSVIEFNKIIELDPMNAEAYLGLAQAYIDMGNTDKAVEALEKGFELTGDERLKKLLDTLLVPEEITEKTTETTTAPPQIVTEEITTTTYAKITVPDLTGLSKEEAIALCEKVGLKYSISEAESNSIEKDFVISQQIPAGAEIDERATIMFQISSGIKVTTAATTTLPVITTTSEVTTTSAETTITPVTTTAVQIREGIETGQCGENVYFTLDKDGTLFVYGTGDMFNHSVSGISYTYHTKIDSGGSTIDESDMPVTYFDDPSPFGGNGKIKHLVVEKGVTSIGDGTFTYCYNLEDISLSNTVETIGEDAFEYCISLNISKIPSTVLTIKEGAFENCSSIKEITLCCNTVERYAFAYCDKLEKIVLTKDVDRIGRCSFAGNSSVQENFPKKVYIFNSECLFYVETESNFQDEVFYEKTVLYGYTGSTTEEYANKFSRKFIALK